MALQEMNPCSRWRVVLTLSLAGFWLTGIGVLVFNVFAVGAISTEADLSVTISTSPEPVKSSQKLIYTIVAQNNGPDSAISVDIVTLIPHPYLFVSSCSATSGSCSKSREQVVLHLTSLATNSAVTATIEAFVSTDVLDGMQVETEVKVESSTDDPAPGNNYAALMTTIVDNFDAFVTQLHSPEPVQAGESVVYTLTVKNLGPSAIYRKIDSTQGNTQPASIPQPVSSWPAPADPYPSAITVNGIAGTLAKVAVTLDTLTHPHAEDLDLLLVSPSGTKVTLMSDAGAANSIDGATITFVDSAPQLSAKEKITSGSYRPLNHSALNDTVSDSYPAPGPGTVTDKFPFLGALNGESPNGMWMLYVVDDHTGDDTLSLAGWSLHLITYDSNSDMSLEVTMPTGFVFESEDNTGWGLNVNANVVSFSRQRLGKSTKSTIILTATASSVAGIYDTSVFLNLPGDADLQNNLTVAETTVITNHDLAIAEKVFPQPAVSGDPITYTLTITNLGPSSAINPQVISVLPSSITIQSILSAQANCTNNANVVACYPPIINSQPLDAGITIHIAAMVSGPPRILESTSSVATQFDLNVTNNAASNTVTVVEPSPIPTAPPTQTHTPTATFTPVPSETPTTVPTSTATPIDTSTNTPIPLPTHTATLGTPTVATDTPIATTTATMTATATPTVVPTATDTQVASEHNHAVYLPLVSSQ